MLPALLSLPLADGEVRFNPGATVHVREAPCTIVAIDVILSQALKSSKMFSWVETDITAYDPNYRDSGDYRIYDLELVLHYILFKFRLCE